MPPKLGVLSKDTLFARLHGCQDSRAALEDGRKYSRQELLERAAKLGLVRELEYERTADVEHVTLKRYLRTMVKDEPFLAAIDNYVTCASLVRAAGSNLANSFALYAYDTGLMLEADAATSRPDFLESTFKDTTFVKYCLLPFKASLPVPPPTGATTLRAAADPPHAQLAAVWRRELDSLEPMYPTLEALRAMGWDQALTDMAREYQGALTSHVLSHLPARVSALFRHRLTTELGGFTRKDRATGRAVMTFPGGVACFASDAYAALERGAVGATLPPAVAALAQELRARCGLEGAARLDRLSSLTTRLFRLHVEMSREAQARDDKSWTACPLVSVERTFAYVDDRVAHQLLARCGNCLNGKTYEQRPEEDKGVSLLAWAFGAHRRAWLEASRAARRQHRRCAGGRLQKACCGVGRWPGSSPAYAPAGAPADDSERVRRRLKRKRRRRRRKAAAGDGAKGASKKQKGTAAAAAEPFILSDTPREARVRSVSTDGVALCVVLEVDPVLPAAKRRELAAIKEPEQLRRFLASLEPKELRELVKMAEDPGRVNLSQMLVKRCIGAGAEAVEEEEHQMRLTRASYMRRSLRARRQQEETRRRRSNRLLQVAINYLGAGNCKWRTARADEFAAMTRRLRHVHDIMAAEYVYDTWYARWRMLLWRRRQSVLAQYYADILRRYAPRGAAVVLGRGAAGFSSSGRGEPSVPTSGMGKAAVKALSALRKRHPKTLLQPLAEDRTTLACHRCGGVLRDILGDDGRVLRGLKECHGGCHAHRGGEGVSVWCRLVRVTAGAAAPALAEGEELRAVRDGKGRELRTLKLCMVRGQRTAEHTSRVFNRDINATKNLMLVLEALMAGTERPAHLRKQGRRRERAVPQERGNEVEQEEEDRVEGGGRFDGVAH